MVMMKDQKRKQIMLHTMFKWTPVTAASLLAMANVCADPLDARLGALETKVQAMSQKDVRGMTQATAVTAECVWALDITSLTTNGISISPGPISIIPPTVHLTLPPMDIY